MLWWGLAALAAGGAGEVIEWDIHYAGISAGTARAATSAAGDGDALAIDTWIKNADWYGAIYAIDDHTRSTWTPGGGSTRHVTRFREGGFQQDQDMRMQPDGFSVWRRQLRKGEGWQEWTTPYDAHPYVEDPITAFYAIRELRGEGPWRFPVFSGEATWPLDVSVHQRTQLTGTPLGDVDVVVYTLQTRHRGEWEQRGRFLVYLTDDARRIPVRIVIKSSIGAIRADLSGYTPPAQ